MRPATKVFTTTFLDMKTGRRAWKCELSTIDTTYLLAAVSQRRAISIVTTKLSARFGHSRSHFHKRADWNWAQNGA